MASTQYTTNERGEKVIAPTLRPDGSVRKERRVRAGYVPQEEMPRYVPRAVRERRAAEAAGGATVTETTVPSLPTPRGQPPQRVVSNAVPGYYDEQLFTPRGSTRPPPGLTRADPGQFDATWASITAATDALTNLTIRNEPIGQSSNSVVPRLALPTNTANNTNTSNGAWARGPPGRPTPRGNSARRGGGPNAYKYPPESGAQAEGSGNGGPFREWGQTSEGGRRGGGGTTPRLAWGRGGSSGTGSAVADGTARYHQSTAGAPARTPRGTRAPMPPMRRHAPGYRDTWDE